jgi:two-component system sensor histidine kinase CpxA
VRVADVVEGVVRREAPEGTDLRVNIDSSLRVMANREYLVRALSNTLRNAIRYAARYGPITISAEQAVNEVAITIADSGPGVPDADLDKIFTPFFRVDDARDRRTGGTGLGLAIVRSCVESCGGNVTARNQKPSGLKIIITLPAA